MSDYICYISMTDSNIESIVIDPILLSGTNCDQSSEECSNSIKKIFNTSCQVKCWDKPCNAPRGYTCFSMFLRQCEMHCGNEELKNEMLVKYELLDNDLFGERAFRLYSAY